MRNLNTAINVRAIVRGALACEAAAASGVEAVAAPMDAESYRRLARNLWDQAFRITCNLPPILVITLNEVDNE